MDASRRFSAFAPRFGRIADDLSRKTVWLTLIAMIVAYTLYFRLVLNGHPAGREMFPMLGLIGGITATQAVVVMAGDVALAMTTPRPERQRLDECDRAIVRRGAAAAYYVMMAGMIIVGVVMPFIGSG